MWVLWYNGEKTCYINPPEAESVLRKYHTFDKVIPSEIKITETDGKMEMLIMSGGKRIFNLDLKIKKPFKSSLINFILKHANKNRVGEKGKTERGLFYHNVPERIVPVSVIGAEYDGAKLTIINKPPVNLSLGDGKAPNESIINYCTHLLEE